MKRQRGRAGLQLQHHRGLCENDKALPCIGGEKRISLWAEQWAIDISFSGLTPLVRRCGLAKGVQASGCVSSQQPWGKDLPDHCACLVQVVYGQTLPLVFSLGDRTLLFTSSECIMDMTLPNWKYYSGNLGRSYKEEAMKENLKMGQSEPLRLRNEYSIDWHLCSVKILNLFYRWGVGVARNKGGLSKTQKSQQESRPGRQWGISDKQSLISDSSHLSFPITWQSVSSLLKTVSWHNFTSS